MLDIANLEVVYNDVILVLRGLSLSVPDGKIVALLGGNGAGKTTTLRAITGLLDIHDGKVTKGSVTFDGQRLVGRNPTEIVKLGIKQVMEGRRVFADLTVDENLVTGGYTNRDRQAVQRGPGPGDGAVPAAGRAAQADRRLPLGRRAADAGDRAGDDDGPQAAGPRRAVARAGAAARAADPRHHRRHQPARARASC